LVVLDHGRSRLLTDVRLQLVRPQRRSRPVSRTVVGQKCRNRFLTPPGTVDSMPRPKQHLSTNRRPCSGFIRAIYTRRTDDMGHIRWESLGWLCDICHKWAESEWELTG